MSQTGPGAPGPEDDMDRRLREIADGIAAEATIKEPSHRERAHKQGRLARRRAARGSGQLERKAARRHRIGLAVTWVVVVAVVGAVVSLSVLLKHSGAGDLKPIANGPVPSLTPSQMTAADPFAGSPAESYADGAAGIAVPPAHALSGYPATEVGAADLTVKRMLIAANLDPGTLRGGSPDAFADLLVQDERTQFVQQLDTIGLDKQGYARSTRGWVTSFAPGSTELVGNVIKVHGTMAATTAISAGRHLLRVHADYLFIYPVQRPGEPSTMMRVVVQDIVNVDFARWDDPQGPLEAWWNFAGGGASGARCDVNDGFIHPAFPGGPAEKVTPSGRPVNPYALSPAPRGAGCQATTGT
jgi:hypothetical protein